MRFHTGISAPPHFVGKSTAAAPSVLGVCCLQLSRPSIFRYSLDYIKYVVCCPERNVLTMC